MKLTLNDIDDMRIAVDRLPYSQRDNMRQLLDSYEAAHLTSDSLDGLGERLDTLADELGQLSHDVHQFTQQIAEAKKELHTVRDMLARKKVESAA